MGSDVEVTVKVPGIERAKNNVIKLDDCIKDNNPKIAMKNNKYSVDTFFFKI